MTKGLKPIENWKHCGGNERMKKLLNYLVYVVNLYLAYVLVTALLGTHQLNKMEIVLALLTVISDTLLTMRVKQLERD